MKKIVCKLLALLFVVSCACIAPGTKAYAAEDELEPNDTYYEAETIQVGTTIYADLDDHTYDLSGTVIVYSWQDYGDTPAWSGRSPLELTVYVDDMEDYIEYLQIYTGTSSATTVSIPVQYGKTYYLRYKYYGIGSYHFKVGYSIGKTSISSVKAKTKGFTVKWAKKSKASFYQVQYVKKSVYEDYGWSKAKTVKVSKKSGSKTISGLAKKTKYYVRVRVARTIDGKTYYSGWTKAKSVKTK